MRSDKTPPWPRLRELTTQDITLATSDKPPATQTLCKAFGKQLRRRLGIHEGEEGEEEEELSSRHHCGSDKHRQLM